MKGRKCILGVIVVSVMLLLELGAAYSLPARSSSDSFAGIDASEALIRKATDAGMDATALAELLRTKQPVVVSNTNAQGETRTITYTLTPDGTGIHSRIVTEHQPTLVNLERNSNLKAAPAASGPENDWEWAPGTRPFHQFGVHNNWPSNTEPRLPPIGVGPRLDGGFGLRPSGRDIFADLPPGVTPKTTTKTEVDDQGRTITTTTKFYSSGGSNTDNWKPFNWPSRHNFFDNNDFGIPRLNPRSDWLPGFDLPAGVTPKTTTNTKIDDQGRKVTTTTRIFSNGIPTIAEPNPEKPKPTFPLPTRPSRVPTPAPLPTRSSLYPRAPVPTPVPRPSKPIGDPKEIDVLDIKTTTPLPSLEEFLDSQYKHEGTTAKTLGTINIDDLSNSHTTINSNAHQPVDDAWLRSLGASYNLNASPANPSSHTRVTSLSRTYSSAAPPSIGDLNANEREILLRAGISNEDILNAKNNVVTKTRVEPDGRVITTTYRVSSS